MDKTRVATLTSLLAPAALALQLADLATFLLAVRLQPTLLHFELGIIRDTYVSAGPLGAIAFKLAGTAVIFAALAIYRGRWIPAVLLVTAVVGALGAYANLTALATVAHLTGF